MYKIRKGCFLCLSTHNSARISRSGVFVLMATIPHVQCTAYKEYWGCSACVVMTSVSVVYRQTSKELFVDFDLLVPTMMPKSPDLTLSWRQRRQQMDKPIALYLCACTMRALKSTYSELHIYYGLYSFSACEEVMTSTHDL